MVWNILHRNHGGWTGIWIYGITETEMVPFWPDIHPCVHRKLLTHWSRVTHICVSNITIIDSDNGLSPGQRQAIILTNAGILLIWSYETNLNEILIEIHIFSFKKMHLKMSSGKWRPFCVGLNVLTWQLLHDEEWWPITDFIQLGHHWSRLVTRCKFGHCVIIFKTADLFQWDPWYKLRCDSNQIKKLSRQYISDMKTSVIERRHRCFNTCFSTCCTCQNDRVTPQFEFSGGQLRKSSKGSVSSFNHQSLRAGLWIVYGSVGLCVWVALINWKQDQGTVSVKRCRLSGIGITNIEINGHTTILLSFTMGIPLRGKTVFILKIGP